jgi:AraC-like DNA-binding protein
MARLPVRPPGVLWPAAGADVYDVTRDESVPEPVSLVVQHLWGVTWRRPAPVSFRAEVLTHPVLQLTFEDAEGGRLHGLPVPDALVHGLVTRVFTVDLPVAGRVTGVAFHPGGLAALLDRDVRELSGRVVPAEEVLGQGIAEVARSVLAEPGEDVRRRAVLSHLADRLAPQLHRVADDPSYRTVRQAVELMRAREHLTLAPVAERVHVSVRTLQRLFGRYVGASPLWVLRRYRLQDAASAIDAGEGEDLAGLATSLGFADQAHFSRAFAQVVGVPPSRYREAARPTARGSDAP